MANKWGSLSPACGFAWAVMLGMLFLVASCTEVSGGGLFEERVSADDFGDRWPLTVEFGSVRCERDGSMTFVDSESKRWALNGVAITAGYPEIDPIWLDNPSTGAKRNIGPLLEVGRPICERR